MMVHLKVSLKKPGGRYRRQIRVSCAQNCGKSPDKSEKPSYEFVFAPRVDHTPAKPVYVCQNRTKAISYARTSIIIYIRLSSVLRVSVRLPYAIKDIYLLVTFTALWE